MSLQNEKTAEFILAMSTFIFDIACKSYVKHRTEKITIGFNEPKI